MTTIIGPLPSLGRFRPLSFPITWQVSWLLALSLICTASFGQSADPQRAASAYQEAINVYGQAQSASNAREQRSYKLERFNRAAILFEAAAAHNPTNPDLWANAGTAYLQAEQLGRAIVAFKRALSNDPDHASKSEKSRS